MVDNSQFHALVAHIQAEGRVCPMPPKWNELWEMLPDKRRAGAGWQPALPLILGGWWHSSAAAKRQRLMEHVEYAASHGALDEVDAFLRALAPSDWHYETDGT